MSLLGNKLPDNICPFMSTTVGVPESTFTIASKQTVNVAAVTLPSVCVKEKCALWTSGCCEFKFQGQALVLIYKYLITRDGHDPASYVRTTEPQYFRYGEEGK